MYTLHFLDPSTTSSLEDAKRELESSRKRVKKLTDDIQEAEEKLARLVRESRCTIRLMENEKSELEQRVEHTLAYLSPLRRLPRELLQEIFLFNFEDYPCCAWVLSSVCSIWRRVALSMPRLWSKIRLVTSLETPADTVRLWLERSGSQIPLDIEIFLHSPPSAINNRSRCSRRSPVNTVLLADEHWIPAITTPPTPGVNIPVIPYASVQAVPVNVQTDPLPLPIVGSERSRDNAAQTSRTRSSTHWGYIAFYYLVEHMHRWERFMFRFDKHFPSIQALKSILGDAPLLREFEVSCAEGLSSPHMNHEWSWLPCARPDSPYQLQALRSVTLQHVPFKWSTPMLQNLHHLNLRSIPSVYINNDRILHIISRCTSLETLSLYFSSVHSAVIPLSPRKLANLKSLTIGGHFNLVAVLDTLILPALEFITIDIDTRDPIEDSLTSLLARSENPPLSLLSLSYTSANIGTGLYYGAGSSIASWNFLQSIHTLKHSMLVEHLSSRCSWR
ncbi:hypothetical protein QCA50_013871 [Cerrena zonata]|uniref:F-box domain-containing protein n=1 Tax=Cerrena zonata TaxID=2478898 RepID=A0AAW0FND2_9APHY